ncbi:unnamed protein product, partial [Linum tenue]
NSYRNFSTSAIIERIPSRWPRPEWHAPWKNYRVISGHLGWVRSIAFDPSLAVSTRHTYMFSAGDDKQVKCWDLEQNKVIRSYHGHLINYLTALFLSSSQQKTIINAMAINEDGVMVTGGDNGSLWFWDWKSGHNFQQAQTIVQPGSLDSEAAIYAASFDLTGSRLITCEADKTIKMWKQDENATPETHPVNFKPPKDIRRF